MLLNGFRGEYGCRNCGAIIPAPFRYTRPVCRRCGVLPSEAGECPTCKKAREEAGERVGVVCRDCSAPIPFGEVRCRTCAQAFRRRDLQRQVDGYTALHVEQSLYDHIDQAEERKRVEAPGAPQELQALPAASEWDGELEVPGKAEPWPRPAAVPYGPKCPTCDRRKHTRVVAHYGARGRRVKEWRELVHLTAVAEGVEILPETPLIMEIEFLLEPSKSLLTTKGKLRKGVRRYPTAKTDGDWDNLAKATLDALHGVLFEDDTWIVEGRARKVWALGGAEPGAVIRWRRAR